MERLPSLCLEFGVEVLDRSGFLYGVLESADLLWMTVQSPCLEPQEFTPRIAEEIEGAVVDLRHCTVTSGAVACIT